MADRVAGKRKIVRQIAQDVLRRVEIRAAENRSTPSARPASRDRSIASLVVLTTSR
jgi:hypothetical protein